MLRKIAVLTSLATISLNTLFAQERDYRKERAELARQEKEEKRRHRGEHEKINYGTNILSASPFSVLDIGIGFGLSYEKIIGTEQNVGIILPIHLLFDVENNSYYGYPYDNNNEYNNAYFYFTPGLKIYPFGQRRVTYAVGPNLMIGAGGGKEWRYNNYTSATEQFDITKLRIGMLVNNYLNVNFTKGFNMSVQAGLGVRYIDRETASSYGMNEQTVNKGMNVTGQFTLSLGYRF
jgi:hypothetical protein